jgi:hypothetical protein
MTLCLNWTVSLLTLITGLLCTVKVKVTLRLTISQSVSKSWCRAPTRYLLLYNSYGLDFVGHLLWREDGSVFCMCCWPLPAQAFSGPSPLGLETIFYCLTFETSIFVTSYELQSHGGGIRPRFHMGSCVLFWCSLMYCTVGSYIENPSFNGCTLYVHCRFNALIVVWRKV